jgi:peptidoglycan/LPS O-acetylase OafA/YrhL
VHSYRREIDGLRFIAVVSVILYHAGLPVVPGGYLGVDIFFVISGFLITSILLRDLSEQDFSVVRFYERRFRRILPALFLITTLSAIPAAFLLLPSQLTDFGYSLIATATFVSNLLFAGQVDYFTNATDLKPLVHTWSLSVEEQFYIFFPPLLFVLYRFGRTRILAILTAIALASLVAAQLDSIWFPDQNFFLTHGRIWELAVGSIAAVVQFYRPQQPRSSAALLGLLFAVVPIFAYGTEIGSPTLFTAVPVVGTALVLLYGQSETTVGRLLSFGPFVLIGLISYSAYLWHQPIFAYARIYFHDEAPAPLMAALVALTFGLSYLTWRFVETPPRHIRTGLLTRRWVFAWAALSIAITVGLGLVFTTQAVPSQVQTSDLMIDPVTEWEASKALYIGNPTYRGDLASFRYPERTNVLIFGDSHSVGTLNMLKMLENGPLADYEFVRRTMATNCLQSNGNGGGLRDVVDACMDTLADDQMKGLFESADVLLYSVRWSARDYLIKFIPDLIAWASDRGIKTIVLSNMPEWNEDAPVVIRTLLADQGRTALTPEVINRAFQPYRNLMVDELNALLRPIVEGNAGLYLDKSGYACDEGQCFAVSDSMQALHTDYGHETVNGANFYSQRIIDTGWFDDVANFVEADRLPAQDSEAVNARNIEAALSVLGVTAGSALQGTDGPDHLVGTPGNDTLNALDGDDKLEGMGGDDFLNGGPGDDILRTGPGRNRMYGDRGDDRFYPGSGINVIKGGPGSDLVVLTHREGHLSLQDFVPGEDHIDASAIVTQEELQSVTDAMRFTEKGYVEVWVGDLLKITLKKISLESAPDLFMSAGE